MDHLIEIRMEFVNVEVDKIEDSLLNKIKKNLKDNYVSYENKQN